MALECEQFLAGLGIPDLDGVIRTSRSKAFTVRAECQAQHLIVMALQGADHLSRAVTDGDLYG